MQQTTISWSNAVSINKHIQESKEVNKQEQKKYLQEFLDNSFEMLDSRDIHFFAEMTGKSANELRRMHKGASYSNLVESFIDDETDDIFDFF